MRAEYRCLIIGPSWVGDMLMAQSLFKSLTVLHPGLQLDVLAPAWSHGILARMPEVRRALEAPFSHGSLGLSARWRLGRELAAESYDQAIVLPNSWKSALVPFFANIPIRTGYIGEFRHGLINDVRRLNPLGMPRLVQRYSALAAPAGTLSTTPRPSLSINPDAQNSMLSRLGISLGHRALALCPGAEFGPSKRWPETHYAAVANAKLQQGWQVWLIGSAKEQLVAETINQLTGNACVNLVGLTSLEEAVDLLACANSVVSNDSGLMHIAAAVDAPLVAVYGSTDPGYTPPFSDRARIVRLGLECSPCFKRECPFGHLDCLNKLTPERVLKELDVVETTS
jgi:heptosyltransferase-2